MSRLYGYLRLSSSDDIAKFRSLSFRLIKEDTGHLRLLELIEEDRSKMIMGIQDDLNNQLKKLYNGNYKFGLCVSEGRALDVLKIKKKYIKTLSLLCHRGNDKLSKIKRYVEERMSNK